VWAIGTVGRTWRPYIYNGTDIQDVACEIDAAETFQIRRKEASPQRQSLVRYHDNHNASSASAADLPRLHPSFLTFLYRLYRKGRIIEFHFGYSRTGSWRYRDHPSAHPRTLHATFGIWARDEPRAPRRWDLRLYPAAPGLTWWLPWTLDDG